MNKEHALIYLYDQKNIESLKNILKSYNITYSLIGDEDLDKTVIDLFEKKEISIKQKIYSFNFILFKNNNRDTITNFYNDCKKQGILFTHKAILTIHNANWKLNDLLIEINEEHHFFQKWEYLHALLKEANNLNPNAFTKESYEPYKTAFLKAYIYTKTMPDKNQIDTIIQDLEKARHQLKNNHFTSSQVEM